MNQAKAGVSLVYHFERLPVCLSELPFVDPGSLPPFAHMEERGVRPPGDFHDHFAPDDEALVWESAAEDFAAFGCRRFECGPPETREAG